MIDLPEETVVQKIVEQTELGEEDVRNRIKEKLTQLSGLISEDGAAHIVANDLGVKLYKTEGALKVGELSTNAKQATVAAKVLRKYEVREFDKNGRQGRVANMVVGDDTGRVRVVFWNDQVDLFDKLNEDDTIQVKNPYVKENNGRLELHLNERSETEINPRGVSITAPAAPQREERELKYLKDLQGGEENIEVLGTIVQVYDPRYFDVCPECNKRVTDDGRCQQHGEVSPVTNYVTTCFLDDGTANVRTTFWKKQTQHLFDLDDAQLLSWKDDPSKAQDPKHELLGEIIKVVGRAKHNEQFDRVELTAQLVIKDVDPEAELKKIQGANEKQEETPQGSVEEKQEPTPQGSDDKPEESSDEEPAAPDAEPAQEEEPAEAPAPTTDEEREVKPEDVEFSDAGEIDDKDEKKKSGIKEEPVSIDDLEDL